MQRKKQPAPPTRERLLGNQSVHHTEYCDGNLRTPDLWELAFGGLLMEVL